MGGPSREGGVRRSGKAVPTPAAQRTSYLHHEQQDSFPSAKVLRSSRDEAWCECRGRRSHSRRQQFYSRQEATEDNLQFRAAAAWPLQYQGPTIPPWYYCPPSAYIMMSPNNTHTQSQSTEPSSSSRFVADANSGHSYYSARNTTELSSSSSRRKKDEANKKVRTTCQLRYVCDIIKEVSFTCYNL